MNIVDTCLIRSYGRLYANRAAHTHAHGRKLAQICHLAHSRICYTHSDDWAHHHATSVRHYVTTTQIKGIHRLPLVLQTPERNTSLNGAREISFPAGAIQTIFVPEEDMAIAGGRHKAAFGAVESDGFDVERAALVTVASKDRIFRLSMRLHIVNDDGAMDDADYGAHGVSPCGDSS